MRSIVATLKVIFIHPKTNNPAYQNTNQARHDGVPCSDKSSSSKLVAYLAEALFEFSIGKAVYQAWTVFLSIHQCQKIGFGKDAGEEPPQGASHSMCVEDP